MTAHDSQRIPQGRRRPAASLAGTLLAFAAAGALAGITDPPVVVYGKVIHVDQGATYQVMSGTLELTLTNGDDNANSVSRTVRLGPTGRDGEFSFRMEFDQTHLPPPEDLTTTLRVGPEPTYYFVETATVDGVPASPLDPTQASLNTSFAARGTEHRIDLLVNLPQEDSDRDGIPDWYEQLNGLNPFLASDARSDSDGDGWDALTEFLRGTRLTESNSVPEIGTTSILVPAGGVAGLFLSIHDSDSDPSDLILRITESVPGLAFKDAAGELAPGTEFTHADMLAGNIRISVDPGFQQHSLRLAIRDLSGTAVDIPFQVLVRSFSPVLYAGRRPALWLDARALADVHSETEPLDEWTDSSGNRRDGYQPDSTAQPSFDAQSGLPVLGGDDFLYLDERGLRLTDYTAFVAFDVSAFGTAGQTVLATSDLRIGIGGDNDARAARSLLVREPFRQILGPVLSPDAPTQLTLVGGPQGSFLTLDGHEFAASHSTAEAQEAVFGTLGGRRALADSEAGAFFSGRFHEVLLYDEALDAAQRTRNEDYQLSRWNGAVIWDYRSETESVTLTGHSESRNCLNGGWGDDVLSGGSAGDTIRGGPGSDQLTGNAGPDRFQFFPHPGDADQITDFNETEDVIDLTPIFGGHEGIPSDYVAIASEVTRDAANRPQVTAVLSLDFNGDGGPADQVIRLTGRPYSSADLRRLVGEGRIQLGGPQFETIVQVTASETELTETERPRTLTVTRSGNLEAALDVLISFVGTAEPGVDYQLSGQSPHEILRTVSFARGESLATLDLTPIQDTLQESERIEIGVLAQPRVTGLPDTPLALSLEDAPEVTIKALVGVAQRLGPVPGILQIRREGPLDLPLEVELTFEGGPLNGRDYAPISPVFTLAAGERTGQLEVLPLPNSPMQDQARLIQLSLVADKTRFALGDASAAQVLIVDATDGALRTLEQWAVENGLDPNVPNFTSGDQDNDFLGNLWEYVFGTDPRVATDLNDARISISNHVSAGFVEIHVSTVPGLTDVRLTLQYATDVFFSNARSVDDSFEIVQYWLGNGRIQRVYRSRLTQGKIRDNGFYRLGVEHVGPPTL